MYIKTENTVNSHHIISTTPQSNHFAPVDRIQVWIDKGVPSEVRPHKSASPHSPLGEVGFEKKTAKDSNEIYNDDTFKTNFPHGIFVDDTSPMEYL